MTHDQARSQVDRSIRLRVRIYALIFVVMAFVVLVDTVVIGSRAVLPVVASLVLGAVVGVLASRMFALSWDSVSGTVVGRLDVLGVVILVLYLAFSIFRGRLHDIFLDGPVLGVAGLAALAGVMPGQVFGTGRGVARVLAIVAGRSDGPPVSPPRP